MCVERTFKEKKKFKLVKEKYHSEKSIRQLVFEICDLRSKQLPKFRKIESRIRKRQKKSDRIGLRKIKLEFRGKEFKKKKLEFEIEQRKKREKKFKEIRKKLEENSGYFKQLEFEIEQRKQELGQRSECTFPVLCQYLIEYRGSQ